MYNGLIVRYCEIHLKGKNRGFFEKMLVSNIKNSIKEFDCSLAIKHSRYVIENYSESDYPAIAAKLDKIAGVHTYSPALVVKNDFNEILAAAVELCKDKSGTFKVITNRADKTFTPDSVTTSMLLGGKLLEIYGDKLSVDVKIPDFCVYADIREDGNIEALIIDQNKSLFSLNRESDTRIFWKDITKIGEDVILVQK